MKCLILAAGYATRLYPLTENFPKPLLKVGDKTILDWLIDDIRSSGIVDEFAVVTNHRFAPIFREWAPVGVTIVDDGTSTNETRLGAGKDIQFAIESLALDDDLLVIAGDNVLDFSLVKFIDYARTKGTSCIMRYFEPDEARLHKCGIVETDAEDRVLSMEEKPAQPRSHWCCPPFYYYTTPGWSPGESKRVAAPTHPARTLPGSAPRQASTPWKCPAVATISATWKATESFAKRIKGLPASYFDSKNEKCTRP